MTLKGIEVKHKAFGIGIVSEHVDNHITIILPQGKKKFVYQDAFKVFIKATDDNVNDEIQKEIVVIEALKKEEEQKSEQTIIKEMKYTYNVPKKAITTSRNGGKQYFFFKTSHLMLKDVADTCGHQNQIKMDVKFHIG